EQKIMYSSKLILNFGFFPFSKKLLFKVYKSKVFKGDINSFEIKLKKLVDLKFINLVGKENNYLYVDTGILSRAIKDYPYDNRFSEMDIMTLFNICIDLNELERIIFMVRKLYISGQRDESIKLLKEANKRVRDNLNLLLELGMQLSITDKNEEAIEVLEKVLKIDNSLKSIWAMISDLYLRIGNYNESNKAIKNAIKYGMNDPVIWYNYGNVLTYENKHSEAEIAFKKSLSLRKDDKKAWFNLGNSLKYQEKYYESEKAYKKALSIDEEYFNALINLSEVLKAQGKIDEAISMLEKIPKTHLGYKIVEWNLGGLTHRKEEKREEIKKENELLGKLNKENKDTWFELLENYIEKNKYSQAEDLAKRAIKYFKNTDGFYNLLGISLYFQQRYEEANESFIKSKIKDYDSYLIWADTLKILKKYYKAHRLYIRALILNKNGIEVWHDMGLNLAEQKKYKIAIKAFLKAIEIDKNFAQSHNALGACYSHINDLVNAEKEFKTAVKINDKFILAWSNLGEIYFQQKKYELAVKALEKAFGFIEETDKQLVECLDMLGKIDESKKYEGMMKSIIYKESRIFNH
ncbi:MAG: tetratricopeptide repeat protein, partial [Actinobacteria bacterium]|nr:tetratricopeptide repeat protein [Actinomycetota bacterium]